MIENLQYNKLNKLKRTTQKLFTIGIRVLIIKNKSFGKDLK